MKRGDIFTLGQDCAGSFRRLCNGEYWSPNVCHLFGVGQPAAPPQQQMSPAQANQLARDLIVKGAPGQPPAVDMWSQIFTGTFTSGVGTVINIPVRNVGLIKRWMVKVTATITAGAQNLTLTPFGASNFWGATIFQDFDNVNRVQSQGWHMQLVSSAKRRRVFGAAYTTDTPCGYGNIFTATETAPASITNGTTGAVVHYMEIPACYTDHDLRGALWANTTSAQAVLQLTANPSMLLASGVDPTLGMYQSAGAAAGTLTTFTVTVYQNYLDQIPVDRNNRPILPLIDLSYAYVLLNTSMGLPVVNQDNLYPYPNFRQFLSTAAIYDNAGTLNIGTDVTYFAIQSANFTNIIKYDPITAALRTRLILGCDPPKGMYYFDHRERPIDTQQYGNITFDINPSSVGGSTATVLLGIEALGIRNLVMQAGSLPSGS
jgi:hypothetical protein